MLARAKKLLHQIELANRRHRLIERDDRLVVAVSGGPDSMALLCLLALLQRKYNLRLVAAHLHHGFIKSQSDRYRLYVKDFCRKKSIPFYSKQVPVRKISRLRGRSLEETGRLERYAFLSEVARKTKSRKIVTGHTLDDQAETMLMRILRGSGLAGLVGIPRKRPEGNCVLIRPLLDCRKKELVNFLRSNRVYYFKDKTNRNIYFYRNRVRRTLMPRLQKHFNPGIQESLANLQDVCQATQDFIDGLSNRVFKRCLTGVSKRKVSLSLNRLSRLHPALLAEVFRRAIEVKKGNLKRIAHSHLAGIADLLKTAPPGHRVRLPDGLVVTKMNKSLDFAFG